MLKLKIPPLSICNTVRNEIEFTLYNTLGLKVTHRWRHSHRIIFRIFSNWASRRC